MNARPTPASVAVDRAGVASVTPRTRNRILAAIMLGIFLSILDQTIVATALPRIRLRVRGVTEANPAGVPATEVGVGRAFMIVAPGLISG